MLENFANAVTSPERILPSEQQGSLGGLALSDVHVAETAHEASIEEVFKSGNLLVRGLDAPAIISDGAGNYGLKYDIIDGETDNMFGEDDQQGELYMSSTLILPGKHIPTYKNFGFMFNGATAKLHHVHPQDSGSHGHGDNFFAATSNLHSLADLAAVVSNEEPQMNEVNATFEGSDLKGIFALEARKPVGKVSALLMQQRLKMTIGVELPIYVYDVSVGDITEWQPAGEEVQGVLSAAYRPGPMKDVYSQELADLVAK